MLVRLAMTRLLKAKNGLIIITTLNITILVELWVASEGLTSDNIFHARSCVRRDYPSEVMEIASYCTNSGRMSRKLVSGNHLSITK